MITVTTEIVVQAHPSLTNPYNVMNVRTIASSLVHDHPTLDDTVVEIGVVWDAKDTAEGWTTSGSATLAVHSKRPLTDDELTELRAVEACNWAVGEHEKARADGGFPEHGVTSVSPSGAVVEVAAIYEALTNNPASSRPAVLAVLAANAQQAA